MTEKKKETVGRRHGIPPHTPPAVPPDFLNLEDFQQKKFELQVKTAAISQETQSRPKKVKESQNVEGGAEFPPEPPLPPRPHLCWRFWEFLKEKSTEHEAKKWECGCGPDGYSPPFTFYFKRNRKSQWLKAAHFRFNRVCGTPYEHIRTAPALPTVPRATVGRVRHTDMCEA